MSDADELIEALKVAGIPVETATVIGTRPSKLTLPDGRVVDFPFPICTRAGGESA